MCDSDSFSLRSALTVAYDDSIDEELEDILRDTKKSRIAEDNDTEEELSPIKPALSTKVFFKRS